MKSVQEAVRGYAELRDVEAIRKAMIRDISSGELSLERGALDDICRALRIPSLKEHELDMLGARKFGAAGDVSVKVTRPPGGTASAQMAAQSYAPAALDEQAEIRATYLSLPPGKWAGIRAISDEDGFIRVEALDQSSSLARMADNALGHPSNAEKERWINETKRRISEIASRHVTGVLLDVPRGVLATAIARGEVTRNCGLIGRIERSYDPAPAEVEPELVRDRSGSLDWLRANGKAEPDMSSERAIQTAVSNLRRMGVAAIKLLVYTRPDDPAFMEAQARFLAHIQRSASEQEMLMMIEELVDKKSMEKRPDFDLPEAVIQSVALIQPYADILKVEFPGDGAKIAVDGDAARALVAWLELLEKPPRGEPTLDTFARHVNESDLARETKERLLESARALERLNAATGGKPWVLLSAGKDFGDAFKPEILLALYFGASGYMVGRAHWKDVQRPELAAPDAQLRFLEDPSENGMVGRIAWTNRQVKRLGTPLLERLGITPHELETHAPDR